MQEVWRDSETVELKQKKANPKKYLKSVIKQNLQGARTLGYLRGEIEISHVKSWGKSGKRLRSDNISYQTERMFDKLLEKMKHE